MNIRIIFFLTLSGCVFAQQKALTVQDAVNLAMENNKHIQTLELQVLSEKQLKKTSVALPKTDVRLMYGQYNTYAKQDNNLTVSQTIPFTALGAQGRFNNESVAMAELRKSSVINDVVYQTRQVYYQLGFLYARRQLLMQQDSIFGGFARSANARYKSGETNLLEKTTAEVQLNEAQNQLRQNESDILVLRTQLKTLTGTTTLPDIVVSDMQELLSAPGADTSFFQTNPTLAIARQQVVLAKAEKKLEMAKAAPDLMIGYFNQTLIGTLNPETGYTSGRSDRFAGFEVGVAIPLWLAPHQGRIKSAQLNYQSATSALQYARASLEGQWQQAFQEFEKNKKSLEYYRASASPNASLILRQAQAAFRAGEIGYAEYLMGVRSALQIRDGFITTLNAYNQSILLLEFLTGNQTTK